LILKSCNKCSKTSNLTINEELVQALVKSKDNWHMDELLELIAHIQEHAKNKNTSKAEYLKILDGVIKRTTKIKERIIDETNIYNK
jgi:hypothetical protein